MKPRKPIRHVSASRQGQLKEYAKLRRLFMKLNPICCVAGCATKSKDLHHRAGRVSRLLTYVPFFRALCRLHHAQVREDIRWARLNDLICPMGQWNVFPKQ